MPDLYVRGIDDAMAERIKNVARERGISLNEAVLELLSAALGLGGQRAWPEDVFSLGGSWRAEETRVFREAMQALEGVDVDALVRLRPDSQPPDEGEG